MPKVTEAHLEARRQQILDAAWNCFARKGYHQTTMQDICQESELSPGAIYRYFASKEAILKAINDRSQEMGRALVEEARSQAGAPISALKVIGQTMLSYFSDPMAETTTRINIEIWPEILRNETLRDGVRKELAFWRRAVAQLISEAKELGQLKPEIDPESLAVVLICTWEGIRHYSLIDPQSFKPERLIEMMQPLVSPDGAPDLPSWTGAVGRKARLRPPLRTAAPRRPRSSGREATEAGERR